MPEPKESPSIATEPALPGETGAIKRAFGAEKRNRLIEAYFSTRPDDTTRAADAWAH